MNYIEYENTYLSPYACHSDKTRGRKVPIEPSPWRTEFQRDRDRIIHSKAFRRLKHKTQVFLSPEGDHYRTRLTHTLEVAQIARTMARALRLNEDLTEAIALGHDLGHTPFGHAGEKVLNQLNPTGFEHNIQSLRVVDCLENDGKGLNLTYEVRDGILNHKSDGNPFTLEGKIVSLADRIAYLNHDIEDAVTAKILNESEIPHSITDYLGKTKSERITTLISDIIEHSIDKNAVMQGKKAAESLASLRSFMFDTVYSNNIAKTEEIKAVKLLELLYGYYKNNYSEMPALYCGSIGEIGVDNAVTDYIAGMSDVFCKKLFNEIFMPKCWEG